MANDIKVKSLYKALKVLECFTVSKPELGITEISEQLGLYKSNVHNIADTFVKAGYLEKNTENDKYRLGFKILELSHIISANISLRHIVLPHMRELADITNETIYLAVPREGEVIYLDSCSPKHQLSTRAMLGIKAPLYCTGIGKAMLAFLPEEVLTVVVSSGLARHTDKTITDLQQLKEELSDIRTRGYAIDNMEHEFGIKCVGMPIRNKNRQVTAGISISGPSLRFDARKIKEFGVLLQKTVHDIEDKL